MHDRERLRRLVAMDDVPATRELATQQMRSPIDEDYVLIRRSRWFLLGTGSSKDLATWRQFAELVQQYPDADDYKTLNEAGRNHILDRDAADIMDAALAKIRRLLSIPEPFSIRNDPRFNRRRR